MRNKIAAQKSRIREMKKKKGCETQYEQTKMEFKDLAKNIDEGLKCAKAKERVKARLVEGMKERG